MSRSKPRILIVDDDPVFRRGLARMFSACEAEVVQLGEGDRAFGLIDAEGHELVLCDYRLPGADGLQLLARLRESGRDTPFILITALYSEELAARATALGATAVFEKPIDLERLRRHCRHALGSQCNTNRAEGEWQDSVK